MNRIPRRIFSLFVALGLAGSLLAVTAGGVAAYGKADQPLAQLEISGNCDNPDNSFCTDVVGVGGIWLWIEIDANGTGDVAGAVCGHTVGGPRGGAQSIHGDVSWDYVDGATAAQYGFAFPTIIDPNDTYYLVWFDGEPLFATPVTQGHYSFHPDKAVTLQVQVAP
jgi:hypothetical protein